MENQQAPKKRGKKFLIYTLLVLILVGIIYYFVCGLTYSEGTRSGILTKVSHKGVIFKTYEGELIVGGINDGDGAILPAKTFVFSISDKAVYDLLEADQGSKVVVHYKEVYKSFPWQGETPYFVHQVNKVHK